MEAQKEEKLNIGVGSALSERDMDMGDPKVNREFFELLTKAPKRKQEPSRCPDCAALMIDFDDNGNSYPVSYCLACMTGDAEGTSDWGEEE